MFINKVIFHKNTQDIQRTEEALQLSELRYKAIVEAEPECVKVVGANGDLLEMNPAGLAMLEANSLDEARSHGLGNFLLPLYRNAFRTLHMNAIAGKNGFLEFEIIGLRGTRRWLETHAAPLPDAYGKISMMLGITRDISVQKAQADNLREAGVQLNQASKLKSDFIANMSHEIRTPLAIIRGYSELMATRMNSDENQNQLWINIIARTSKQLELLINDILDLSKVEAGKIEVESRSMSLPKIIDEVRDLLVLKISEKGIRLDFAIEGSVPRTIKSDPLRLKQILLNVIGNAIKFTEKGSVLVKISFKPADCTSQHSILEFAVTDTGIGISPEQKQKIFEAFNQVDSSITKKFGGTGLGLTLSRELARLLGGDVEVSNSETGKGSTFTITINPGAALDSAVLQAPYTFESQEFETIDNIQATESLKGMRFLLVDDAEDIRALVSFILHAQGAIVSGAANGEEGIEACRNSSFDIILMDLQMPVMDGLLATQKLRSEGCMIPIIAVTAHAMTGERERCIAAGFTDYLSKPINFNSLIQLASKY